LQIFGWSLCYDRTTHGSEECVDACKRFASLIFHALNAESKAQIFELNQYERQCMSIKAIAGREFMSLNYAQVIGSGYVVKSLKAALWCFFNGDSLEECILLAANLGDDADTTAAVCGQIAGAYYGFSHIRQEWRDTITQSAEIEQLEVDLYSAGIAMCAVGFYYFSILLVVRARQDNY
jgi:ADP-ribosyl-[dinitrogen reductase] hydrolase